MRHVLLVVLGLLLLVPACGGDDEEAATRAPHRRGEVVDVALRDFTIDPSTINVEPGTYTFHVVNDGATVHALEVEGPSGEVETSELEPGDSADLTVDLGEDGEYEMYCPVDGHQDRGMEGTVAVGAGAAGGAVRRRTRRRPRTRTTATSLGPGSTTRRRVGTSSRRRRRGRTRASCRTPPRWRSRPEGG